MATQRSSSRWAWLYVIGWLVAAATTVAAGPVDADLLLQGGTLYDGSGAEGVAGDVAVRDGRIVAVGKVVPGKIGRTIDCRGQIVAPGFIDVHTHADQTLSRARACRNYIFQGCTTLGTGNCGGAREVRKFLDEVDTQGAGTNIFHLVGHGTVRKAVLGSARRKPTAEELDRMKAMVIEGMRDGAWGMSSGLIYPPSSYAETDELVALARVVAEHGGIYVSHIRNEAAGLQAAVAEAIRTGRESGAAVHISHFKSMGIANWGGIRTAAAAIEKARVEGLKVTADQYPYTASSTSLVSTTLPDAQIRCPRGELAKRMADDAEFAAQVRRIIGERLAQTKAIVFATCKKHPNYVGKSLKEVAAQENRSEVDLVLAIVAEEDPQVINHAMAEDDIRYGMTLAWVATASDGAARVRDPNERHHPRNFGTFARTIGRYAIEEKVLPLAQAIRSATGLPADIFQLPARGYLRAGYYADIVVFDPATYRDRATFDAPQEYASGVRYVLVAGQTAVDDARPNEKLFGRVLRHKTPKKTPDASPERASL